MTTSQLKPTRRSFVGAALGALGSLAGCGESPKNPPEPGDRGTRIPYGPGPSQFGDLRLPAGAGPHPVLVVIHGGFWRAGFGHNLLDSMCEVLSRDGWATWNIEYRRVGEDGGGWPGTFLDVAAAADHLRELAGPHAIDLRTVVTVGHSAGGHLALWAAARHKLPPGGTLHRASPLPIKGAVSLAGVPDLRKAAELKLGGDAVSDLLGGSPAAVPDRYAAASPVDENLLDPEREQLRG